MWLTPERSEAAELLDRPGNTEAELRDALRDIRLVNRFLGGRRVLFRALRPFLLDAPPGGELKLLDVGTGGADLPLDVARYARRLGRRVRITAIDLDPGVAAIAHRAAAGMEEIEIVRADARALPFAPKSFDLVTASMFLHHFGHVEIVRLLRSFAARARRAVVVNDLRRHLVPYGFIHLFARVGNRSAMFAHDAPLSVLRGFTPDELRRAADEAGAGRARIERGWPFRLVLALSHAPRRDP